MLYTVLTSVRATNIVMKLLLSDIYSFKIAVDVSNAFFMLIHVSFTPIHAEICSTKDEISLSLFSLLRNSNDARRKFKLSKTFLTGKEG